MGHTACTEPQCLYKGALYFFTFKYIWYHKVFFFFNMVLEPTYLFPLCSGHLTLIYLHTTDNIKCRNKTVIIPNFIFIILLL